MSYFPLGDIAKTDGSTFTGDLVLSGGNLIVANGEKVAGRDLVSDGAIIDQINSGPGIVVQTGPNTFAHRSLSAGSNRVSIMNSDGVAGNVALDVVESNLSLNNLGGTLNPWKGGTGLMAPGTPGQILGVANAGEVLEYKNINAGSGVEVSHTGNTITVGTKIKGPVQTIKGAFTPSSGTTLIPLDNSIPLISEGTQVWSQTITPTSATNTIRLCMGAQVSTGTGNVSIVIALFRGSTCLDVRAQTLTAFGLLGALSDGSTAISFNLIDNPNTTSPVTYSLRVGITGGSWYFGRTADANFGGATAGQYIVEEILN